MSKNKRSLWLTLALLNLSIVAFLGFSLRSKILFPLPSLDFSNLLSAHSHFAFAGWAGLALITLLIYDVLPPACSQKQVYQWVLIALEVSGLGMAFTFPFYGYNALTIAFSTVYVIGVTVFTPVFVRDVVGNKVHKTVSLLSISAVASLLLSFLGTLGLMYIILSRSGGSLLYRDSIYVFLHFQYNGFFTLSVFALFFNYLLRKSIIFTKQMRVFSLFLTLSVIPTLFLALLWHNMISFYGFGAIGCLLVLVSLLYLYGFLKPMSGSRPFTTPLSRTFWVFAVVSFTLKMILQVGTIFPQLGNAVYGDRPVIIGFLHLVFLGFITFFLLSQLVEDGYFILNGKQIMLPFLIFAIGIIGNELLLMLQGLGILLNTNNDIYKWLLWGVAIILFTGAFSIAVGRLYVIAAEKKKATRVDGLPGNI